MRKLQWVEYGRFLVEVGEKENLYFTRFKVQRNIWQKEQSNTLGNILFYCFAVLPQVKWQDQFLIQNVFISV